MSNEITDFTKKSGSSLLEAMEKNPEKAGRLLLKVAGQRADVDFSESVILRIKELISHRNNLRLALKKTQAEIALFDSRLEAIESGDFTVDGYGQIRYTDAILNY